MAFFVLNSLWSFFFCIILRPNGRTTWMRALQISMQRGSTSTATSYIVYEAVREVQMKQLYNSNEKISDYIDGNLFADEC